MSEAIVKAASFLVEEGVDLSKIPDRDKDKIEFLDLVRMYLEKSLNSLQKARLEYLADHMTEIYKREVEKEEKAAARKLAEEKRLKKEKERKMLSRKTKRGQPILRNLAKIQLERVQEMIKRENTK